MSDYNPHEIEPKWQKRWADDNLYRSQVDWSRPKHYALTMLPYPSGDLHIGHWYAMTPSDARARYMRMKGYNVMFPIGFDAFGLPAEQAAISRNIHPAKWTYANIERMRQQLRSMGAMFDWQREAVTCNPEYYKWTEWFFKIFYENDLAYRGEALVNWSDALQTVLANEQVIDGKDERLGQPVIQKLMTQWFFRYTAYTEELLDFSKIDWPEPVKIMQTNWIGRSEGAQVTFRAENGDPIEIFTTRPDTLWGATFMVLAPEHKLVDKITTADQRKAVVAYQAQAARATEIERLSEEREKTGVFTGGYATNPVNGEKIPVWIADYVMISYGTGAIMAVPAHDERDFAFAVKFGLPIIPVIARNDGCAKSYTRREWVKDGFTAALDKAGFSYEVEGDQVFITMQARQVQDYVTAVQPYVLPDSWLDVVGSGWVFVFADEVIYLDSIESDSRIMARCRAMFPPVAEKRTAMEMLSGLEWYRDVLYHDEYGTMIHSGSFTGTPGIETGPNGEVIRVARSKVTEWLAQQDKGYKTINYRLRDWLISRQRYWGCPIPVIHRQDGMIEAVPDKDLPVLLPDNVDFKPTGQSPLTYYAPFLNTVDSEGHPARRETDTMDTFMCSSWYWYRYLSPHHDQAPFDPEEAAYWLPVDVYTGGAEHATMHLLYARWFAKAIRDLGVFDDTIRIMKDHGRDPEVLKIGEPMLVLRNQGQVLGAEREGDYVVATGKMDGDKLIADQVEVVEKAAAVGKSGKGVVAGELMKRVENTLFVGEAMQLVEVPPSATVNIPSIVGENDVNQLKHHLEIQRMSKSKGNVVNPDELVRQYGADTVRAYLMFNFDWQKGGPWNEQNIKGPQGWLNDVWAIVTAGAPVGEGDPVINRDVERKTHQAVRAVEMSLENFSFNTAVADQMKFKNQFRDFIKTGKVGAEAWRSAVNVMLRLMAPIAPHIAEELWARAGFEYSVHLQSWPEYDAEIAREDTVSLVVMVNGKVRDKVDVPVDIDEETARQKALETDGAQRFMEGKTPKKIIFIAGRNNQEPKINIVV